MNLDAFIQALPKTETHLHIEGALPYELLHAWKPELYPEKLYTHAADHRFGSFKEFDEVLLGHALPWFTSAERYHEAAKAVFAKHAAQNVRYVETSFHLAVTQFTGTPGREIIAAIRDAAPAGLEVRVYAGMLRSDHEGALAGVIDDLANWNELAGVDLHGNESAPTLGWTAPVWARLRAAGKVTKCHAGEFDGAARVREAIEELGVTRVQHGVRAVEDAAVVALARERGATFDVCPISNVRLGVAADMAAHPLRALMAAGINCTVSTDDPLVFGNSIHDEYRALADGAGFSRAELARVAANGWAVADVAAEAREAARAEIARVAA